MRDRHQEISLNLIVKNPGLKLEQCVWLWPQIWRCYKLKNLSGIWEKGVSISQYPRLFIFLLGIAYIFLLRKRLINCSKILTVAEWVPYVVLLYTICSYKCFVLPILNTNLAVSSLFIMNNAFVWTPMLYICVEKYTLLYEMHSA